MKPQFYVRENAVTGLFEVFSYADGIVSTHADKATALAEMQRRNPQ